MISYIGGTGNDVVLNGTAALFRIDPAAAGVQPLTPLEEVQVLTDLTCYPNPFQRETQIEYTLAQTTHIDVVVLDMRGQLVSVLSNGEQEAGKQRLRWDASSQSPGAYLVRIQLDSGEVLVRKVLLARN